MLICIPFVIYQTAIDKTCHDATKVYGTDKRVIVGLTFFLRTSASFAAFFSEGALVFPIIRVVVTGSQHDTTHTRCARKEHQKSTRKAEGFLSARFQRSCVTIKYLIYTIHVKSSVIIFM